MIIKFWERQEVRTEAFAIAAKFSSFIERNDANRADLWTHFGGGFWIGCWHPNGGTPILPRFIGDHAVTNQFLPPTVTTEHEKDIGGKLYSGTNSGVPNIRIAQTDTYPDSHIELVESGNLPDTVYAIGWVGGQEKPLMGAELLTIPKPLHEYETSPSKESVQYGVLQYLSGESGGPTFSKSGKLVGIHRGPGGWKSGVWASGVDTWLGHPQVNAWIKGVLPSKQADPVPQDNSITVIVPRGCKVIIKEV